MTLRHVLLFALGACGSDMAPPFEVAVDDVRKIRAVAGVSQSEIAKRFGISQNHVSDILSRKKWWFV